MRNANSRQDADLMKLKQLFYLTLFCIICSPIAAETAFRSLLTSEEKSYLLELGEIRLCVGVDAMPLDDIQNGKHKGIGAEYIRLIQQRIQTSINLVETSSWNESLAYIKSNQCDIIGLAARTPQREKYLLFSDSYVEIPFVIITTQEKFFVSALDQIANEKLGVLAGYAYVDLLKIRYPDIELVEVKSRLDGLDRVTKNELFGYLTGLNLAGYAIQKGGYTNLKINGQFDELTTINLGLGIRIEMPLLKDILNKAIASIDENERARINNSWLTVRYEIVEDFQRVIFIAIIATILLLFLFYRQYYFRKHTMQIAENKHQIWQQANFDFLTSLPNRRLFQDRLEQQIVRVKRHREHFALLLIDLDEFKDVNDTLGHEQGDKLLIEAAIRIKSCLRESDTIARLGGDEFVVIIDNIRRNDCTELVAKKIMNSLQLPFKLQEDAFISASIGITLCPKDSSDLVELLKNADQAMYAAKANGRNNFHYFTQSMQQSALLRATLIRELRTALDENQFEIYYQPIQNLKSDRINKAEALLRWNHPEKGLIPPIDFISVLEETRMIIEVGEWVFIESAKQALIWRDQFDPDFQISVNTSPMQFHVQSTHKWHQLINDIGTETQAIGIEITESMLMEGQDNISSHLIDLRDLGFQVSLDDFGTGYSSLSYLKKFDIDYLKIDKSFVNQITKASDDLVLCEAIIVMAHRLGLKVIAEGIESQYQLELLTESKCDFGQGYHIAKPMPVEEFEKLLFKNHTVWTL